MSFSYEVQYYDHVLQRLVHPWSRKIAALLDHRCITVISPTRGFCAPIPGYNTRTYEFTLDVGGWQCTCQGFRKRHDCSHVQALMVHLQATQPSDTQPTFF